MLKEKEGCGWHRYYMREMERIERRKKQLERAFLFTLALWLVVNILLLFFSFF